MSMVQKGPNLRDFCRWDCPLMDWYKINFDGAFKGNLGIAGCGIVIRDAYGEKVGCMAIPIGSQTNHVAKASAALYCLIYAKSLNLRKVWVEGDYLNIINCLSKITKPSWTISNIILQAININIINFLKYVLLPINLGKQIKLLTR